MGQVWSLQRRAADLVSAVSEWSIEAGKSKHNKQDEASMATEMARNTLDRMAWQGQWFGLAVHLSVGVRGSVCPIIQSRRSQLVRPLMEDIV